jgi:hypothetical protein
MGVFCNQLKLRSTGAPDCRTAQNKGRYHEQELSFLLVLLIERYVVPYRNKTGGHSIGTMYHVLDQKGVSHALILLGMVLLFLLAVMTMENQTSPP